MGAAETLSLLAGALVHKRLPPPLGQWPGLEACVCVPRAFPVTLVGLHLAALPFAHSPVDASLSLAAIAVHLATALRFGRVAAQIREHGLRLKLPSPPSRPTSWVPIALFAGAQDVLFPRSVRVRRAVDYYGGGASPSPRCLLDIWHDPAVRAHPEVAKGKGRGGRRAVLYVHGGAWNMGDRLVHPEAAMLHKLAAEGHVVFSCSYRFAWEAPFPACLDDARAALAYAARHAREYLDAGDEGDNREDEPVVLIGASAGAHLCALLLQECERGQCRGVSAALLLYPALDVRDALGLHLRVPALWPTRLVGAHVHPILRAVRPGRSLLETFFEAFVLRLHEAPHVTEDEAWRGVSPSEAVEETASTHCRPLCIIHGDHDSILPIEASQDFLERRRWARAGQRDESFDVLVRVPGGRHSFTWLLSDETRAVHEIVLGWVAARTT